MSNYEYCCNCEDPTGRAGRGDDSIYVRKKSGEEVGPICEDCRDDMETRGELEDSVQIDEKPIHGEKTINILKKDLESLLSIEKHMLYCREILKVMDHEPLGVRIGSMMSRLEWHEKRVKELEAVVKDSLMTQTTDKASPSGETPKGHIL